MIPLSAADGGAATPPNDLVARTSIALRLLTPRFGITPSFLLQRGIDSYRDYLAAMYFNTVASVPLMCELQAKLKGRASSQIVGYLDRHIEDERDHDRWLLEDLESLGNGHVDALLHGVREHSIFGISQAIGSQYYFLNHDNPRLVFAYILAEELSCVGQHFVDEVQRCLGLPASGLRTLSHHAEVDSSHVEQLHDVIRLLQLDVSGEREFVRNACEVVRLVGASVRSAIVGCADVRTPT